MTECIASYRKALTILPTDHPDLISALVDLVSLLSHQHDRIGETADLDNLVPLLQREVEKLPSGNPRKSAAMGGIAVALWYRYARAGQTKDLTEAIGLAEKCLDLALPGDPKRASRLVLLANCLECQYKRTYNLADLTTAIDALREAINQTPPDHPALASSLWHLSNTLRRLYAKTRTEAHQEEAISRLKQAWNCQASLPFDRVRAAAECLYILIHQRKIEEALEIGSCVLDLLPVVQGKLLDREDQQFVVKMFAGVATNVCALWIALNQPIKALEQLERGRAVIIGQLLDRLFIIVARPPIYRRTVQNSPR